ncbi:MAG: PAAR domain-containing protein [Gammaproteobacteria bacterium]|uniref:PAAR domain-containing protein n=1 Tax=Limnobacter sp. TaxID=2003368 RepID=UPI001D782BEB|nr:PAAR domain-containing protein [Limnobacter sp.]MBU0783220.1 PAAR domain-containing protein [Gammaproteobacteria bacterium]MBU0850439.1 PAAR domain-containing protein [Gammaproteobacteria bacterium]MBU1268298.1 PAAR domain-containing protein [Gammaproteobacteria bacterium]MBU1528854.1 PAAR domain-containing protein [Gammaproteobacteria bacterium]MBU1780451.1 PAAR domain-containing protein [Gammaproteobacteria bacterium]
MPLMIRQGDTTSHGGTVLEGFPFYTVEGRAVAAMGHKVACPLCKGVFPIAQGNPAHTFNNVPLAYEGMKTACGASLIASQASTTHTSPTGSVARVAEQQIPDNPLGNQTEDKVVQFVIRHHETQEPLEGVPYSIKLSTGATETGHSNADGLTRKLVVNKTVKAELIVHAMP